MGVDFKLLGKHWRKYSSDNGSSTERHPLAYYAPIRVQGGLRRERSECGWVLCELFAGYVEAMALLFSPESQAVFGGVVFGSKLWYGSKGNAGQGPDLRWPGADLSQSE